MPSALHRLLLTLLVLSIAATPAGAAPAASGGRGKPDVSIDVLSRGAILDVMRRATDYQLEQQSKSKDNGWIRAAFYTGLMATWRATGDARYLDQAIAWGEQFNFTPSPPRHGDNDACVQTYAELYLQHEPDERFVTPARVWFDRQMATPQRGRVEWWWCDALYMSPPALARLAAATGDKRYLAYMDEMWWDTHDFLYSKEHRLFFRDASFFERKTKTGKPVFWARGNGWVMGGTARVLQLLPQDHPSRPRYVELFKEMAAAVAPLQGEDGLWRPSLLDAEEFPTGETSGTSFFTFALAWGINNGLLDRATYEPVVTRGWRALVDKVTPEGRLTHVQSVAAAPGAVRPDATHEYAVGAFLLAAAEMLALAPAEGGAASAAAAAPKALRFDFGGNPVEKGHVGVALGEQYDPARGFGWTADLGDAVVLRDRRAPDALRRDYVFGRGPAEFRVDVTPGATYRVTMVMGDMEYGNHVLQPSVDVDGVKLPELRADQAEFATLSFGVTVPEEKKSLTFALDSPVDNWVLNALTLEPADRAGEPKVEKQRFAMPEPKDTWKDVAKTPDPTAPLLEQFRERLVARSMVKLATTGVTRDDYLKLIAGNVDFYKDHQDERGAIIDPHRKAEFQYSTPCFAWAAAALIEYAGREDLVEPAARAMDWACESLSAGQAANHHEDFFPPNIAHALPLLKKRVAPERYARWVEQLKRYDPYKVYRNPPGGGNWNVVALSGEYLYTKLGIRPDASYVERSLAAQGRHFDYPYGLYTEGPMAYDHFPRLWAADLVAAGYDGPNAENLAETLRRAALTSLFMQSPTGELPTGGRSAHHQWNEAEQAVTYEVFAARALAAGDAQLAGVYKRAARLALKSMFRWQRPSGEMWIVKNKFDPSKLHGYEGYSSHSQYNLLPMAMLAIAYEHAAKTEDVREVSTPAEVGGFVLDLRPVFHKVIANAGGMYVEVDVTGDQIHNPTGLLRVHKARFNPQLGPSDGIAARTVELYPEKPTTTAAVGVAWHNTHGQWRRLAEYDAKEISAVELLDVQASPERVTFQLVYQGYFSGPAFVSERYVVTPERVEVTTELPKYDGPVQLVWPVLSELGEDAKTEVRVDGKTVSVSLAGDTQTFTAPGADTVSVEEARHPFRNGYARLGVAEFPKGTTKATLVIEPKPKP